jgi:hypothetical protein
MPAGSGPQVARVTAGAPTASEIALITSLASNWSPGVAGIVLSVSVNFTPGASQTLTTLRLRQGVGTGGALVGIAHPTVTVAAQQLDLAFEELDNSAFATGGQQGGQYTLTIQTNAAGPGAVNQAVLQIETPAPVQ